MHIVLGEGSSIGIGPLVIIKVDAGLIVEIICGTFCRKEDLSILWHISAAQSIPGVEIPPGGVRDRDNCEGGEYGDAHGEKKQALTTHSRKLRGRSVKFFICSGLSQDGFRIRKWVPPSNRLTLVAPGGDQSPGLW